MSLRIACVMADADGATPRAEALARGIHHFFRRAS